MIIGAAYHAQQIQAAPNAPTLEITKSIDGNLSEVESGEPFTYKLAYRCVSISENCLNAEITDALPAPLEFVSLTSNPTHVDTASYDSGSNTITFDMVDPLPAGSTGFVRIEAQFPAGTLPGTLATNTATFDADNGGPSPSNPVDIISTGVFEMFPRKEIVNTDVIIGFPIDFNVELCSPDSRGGVNLTNVAFVDQLPPEATFVTAEGTDGVDWTYDSGLHQLTFTNLPDATPAGCLSRSVTVIHNSAPSGTQTNTLTVTGTPEGCDGSITPLPAYCNGITGDIPLGPIGVDYEVDPPFAEGTTGKTSYSASTFNGRSSELNSGAVTSALPGEAVTYTVSARNSGYLTLTNAMLTDTIPTEIMVTRFTVPLAEDATVSGFYQTNDTGWQPLPGNPYAATTAVDVSSLGLGAGDFITTLAWDFGQLAPQSNRWAATVTGIVDPTLPAGTTFQNCADFSADSTDGLQTGQNCNTVRVVNPRSIPRVTKSNNTGPYLPGDEFDFTISLRNDQVAHQDFIDPILVDVLPAGIELIPSAIRYVGTASGFVTPTQTIINDSPNPGETTIRWEWPGNLAPGDEVSMEIGVQVSDDTTPGRYHNTGVAFSNNPANTNIYGCEGQPTEYTDVNDLDNDGDTTELTCQNPSSEGFADVSVFLAMDSRKQVQGARDNRFQELGLTYPGGELNWKIAITNTSNVPMTDIVLYDILSYIGDTGVIDPQARGSEWRPNMLGPVVIPGGIPATVYYSQELNPCRPEIANISGCVDDWTTVFPDDPGTVQAIKFELCDAGGCYEMPIDSSIEFTWPMVAPNDAPTDASCETAYDAATYQQFKSSNPACSIAWNSFGFTGGGSGETLLAAEPLRVGIRVSDSPRFLLGDFVWLDVAGVGQDHLQQLTEQNLWGVNGVRVELWNADTDAPYDLNNDSVGDFRYTSPDHNGRDGYYLFGDLPAGNYFLRFFPPAGYSTSIANQGGDDAADSDGETSGVDATYGTYLQTADIALSADDLTWDQGLGLPTDYGDLPFDGVNYTYPVTTTNTISPALAARHIIVPDLMLGATVDAEIDGQPTIDADGDDNATDDEDGIVFTTPIIPGNQACLEVTATTTQTEAANLSAWFDFNGDGSLTGSGEQIFADVQPSSGTPNGVGVYEHCFNVPASAAHNGTLYSRFRLSTVPGLASTGTATDGEVEDYAVRLACVGNYVYDDNDRDNLQSAGDLGIDGVAVNLVWGGPDGLLSTTGDNRSYATTTDSNGEYHFCGLMSDVGDNGDDEYQISIPTLPGFTTTADQGGDDTLDSDGDSSGNGPVFTVPMPLTTDDTAANDNSYEGYPDDQDDLRFDFGFIIEYDWGDLPDGDGTGVSFPTNNTNGGEGTGPSHQLVTDLYLGDCVDGETNGQPSAAGSADQDDANAGALVSPNTGTCAGDDDEDGIVFATPLVPGHQACVHVSAQTAAAQGARISAWLDLNADGDLDNNDSIDRMLNNRRANSHMTDLGGGIYEYCFTVPASSTHDGTLYSRFRLSTEWINSAVSNEPDGEVEDYALETSCVGNYIFDDNDRDNTQSAGDTPIENLTVNLVWGGADGVISTASDNITYTTSTDSNGKYHFCGLILDGQDAGTSADEYQISVPTFPSDIVTADQGGNDALDSDGDANGRSPIFDLSSMNTDDATNDTSGSGSGNSGLPDDQDDLSFDFGFQVEYDYGDLPDDDTSGVVADNYATNDTDGASEGVGPSHRIVEDMYLGSCVDAEDDGQSSAIDTASADDSTVGVLLAIGGTCTGSDDEDGVVFTTPVIPGEQACVSVTATTAAAQAANLFGWVDFSSNGSLTDSGEAIIAGVAVNSGTNLGGGVYEHCFAVPASASHDGTMYSRFRLSTDSGLTPFGIATNGEVEDYALTTYCVGNYVWDDNGDGLQNSHSTDVGLNGIDVNLVWGGADGLISTSADNITHTTTTDSNGIYHVCGLIVDGGDADTTADEYRINIPTAPGDVITTDAGADDALDNDGDANGFGPIFSVPGPNTNTDDATNDTSDGSGSGIADAQDDLAFDFAFRVEYDWGDLPDSDAGVGANSYGTNNTDGGEGSGPVHQIIADTYLGNCVDGEDDGQPSATGSANLDDTGAGVMVTGAGTCTGSDDEDGIVFATPLVPGTSACVHVTASTATAQAANVYGWADLNANGYLTDTNEAIIAGVAANSGTDLGGGVYEHCFNVPASTAHSDTLYSRFRLSTDGGLTPYGAATNGEVEDYAQALQCVGNYVFDDNDLNDTQSAGDMGINGVQVNLVWGGADGLVSTTGDNTTYTTTTDINGLYHFCGLVIDGQDGDTSADEYQLVIPTTPGSVVTADQGGDDALDSDGDASGNGPIFDLATMNTDDAPNDTSGSGGSEIADAQDDLSFDFGFVVEYDWGDLPDDDTTGLATNNYPTNIINGAGEGVGPSHQLISGYYLGNCVDGEIDGQPSAIGSADSDDNTLGNTSAAFGTCVGNDDEDGVVFTTPLIPNETACLHITASDVTANLFAFIDWNEDGTLDTATERMIAGAVNSGTFVSASTYEHCFTVPASATMGSTLYSRFRYSTDADLDATGPASNGEVEDYATSLACVGNFVFMDNGGMPYRQDSADTGLGGIAVNLVWGGPDGIVGAGGDDVTYNTTTSSSAASLGEYHFCGLPSDTNGDSTPDEYQIQIPTPPASLIPANLGSDAVDSDGMLSGGAAVAPVFTIANANGMIENEAGTHGSLIPTGSDDNSSDLTFDFGFEQILGAIGNYVWVDENSDGLQDAGEPGIPNVTVILLDATNTPIMTTTTDANGGYLFPELPVGTYSVDVVESTIPSGMSQTTTSTNTGGDFGNQDHSGNGYSVTIGNGEPLENLTADFGYNYNPTDDVNDPSGSPTAGLGDRVWYDTDADGKQDADEIGIYNVCVELFSAGPDGFFNTGADNRYGTSDDDSVSLGTQNTDYTGYYFFDNLTPGSYVVQVCQSSLDASGPLDGLSQTGDPDHFGSAETGAYGENDNLSTTPIILGPGDVFLNVDFGYDGGTVGSIGDTVFFDTDADGNGPSMTAIDDASAVTQGAGGSADSADSGIAGVTVSLIRDLDGDGIYDAGEPIIATTQTDENGQYLFSGLPVDDGGGDSDADYIVWVNDTNNVLDGMEQTYDDDGAAGTPNQSAVAISSGSPDARDQDFGYSESIPQGSIGDTIWNDVDNSGTSTPDGGEPGIPNVTVNLFADEDGDGVADDINGDGIVDASDAIATTTTDENGNYLFSGLPLGSYLVEVVDETLPAGFSSSPTYDPDGGTPANVGATVTLSETNPTNREQDFSYTASNTSLSSIGDQIWGDLANDGNATLDSVDVPLAGVEVTLTDGSGGTQTTTTDENGFYLFNNLPANSYTVTVNTATLPAGYSTTPSFDPDLTMDSVVTYTLGTSEHERARDFSYPPTAPEGMIGDTVWLDIDGDGNGPNDEGTSGGDNNEPGIADACVHLYQDLGAIGTYEPGTDVLLATTVTDENGNYLFSGLSLDDSGGDSDFDYVVVVDKACLPSYVNPESTYDEDAPTTDSISFTSLSAASFSTGSHVDLDQDFGYEPATALGTIGDTIWFDVDGLGGNTPDAGEQGLEGVIVLLTDDKGNTWTTTTDENGNYQFGDLPLSTTYTVTVSASNFASDGVLEGMSNTYDPDDNDDNTGVGITLTDSAPVNLDQDFSYAGAAGQLGNLVWFDNNADGNDDSGTAGSGEAPIGNVTIDLYRDLDCDGLIDAGEPLFGSTTTLGAVDAVAHGTNGVYDFDGLPVSGSGPSDGSCWAVDVTDVNDELVGLWKSSGSQGTDDNSQIDPYTDTGLGALQLTAGNPSNLTADFGYYLYPAAVGNFVWFDINYDGVQDAGEFGINNLTTTLKIDYPDGTTITVSMLTGDNPATAAVERGWYSFANLLIDEDYAASTGTSTASGTQPALTLSVDTARYTITKLDDAAATDMTDADNPAGVAALATMGMFDATQNVTPTLESDPVASYDFGVVSVELGDLPDIYNTLVSNSGAQHIIFPDDDGDNMPDVTGAIWSGVLVDIETDGQGGGDFGGSEGDDDDLIDDEDGLILPPQTSLIEGNNVTFTVTLRSRGIQMADYGLWIDWNGDGDFLGTNEFLNMNDVNINTLVSGDLYETTFTLQTVVPSGTVMHPGWIYVRGRVFEANASVTRDVAVAAHRGLAGNGEVEDFAFRMISPTAVGLSSAETTQTSTNIVTLLATIMLSATLLFVLYKRNNTDKQSS
ncbi:MAG: SdrD B-like domain-containing protein [Candidatus Promineifilaceae bacterium]